MTAAAVPKNNGDRQAFASRLAKLVKSLDPAAELLNFRRLSGGASQESWMIETSAGEQRVEFVLRRGQGGSGETRSAAIGLPTEAALIRVAARHGVPVPAVVHILQPGDALGTGFLMWRVHGETIARRIFRDAAFADVRPRLATLCGQVLAGIATLPVSECPPLRTLPARARLDQMREHYLDVDQRRPVSNMPIVGSRNACPQIPSRWRWCMATSATAT